MVRLQAVVLYENLRLKWYTNLPYSEQLILNSAYFKEVEATVTTAVGSDVTAAVAVRGMETAEA